MQKRIEINTGFTTRPVAWIVTPADDPRLFSRRAYRVEIDDEGGGEFVNVQALEQSRPEMTSIDGADWPMLKTAIDRAFEQIAQYENTRSSDD